MYDRVRRDGSELQRARTEHGVICMSVYSMILCMCVASFSFIGFTYCCCLVLDLF